MSRNYGNQKKGGNLKRDILPNRAKYKEYRIVQRNLVYVIGIPKEIASESLLSQYEYFGQYGKIKKIFINSGYSYNGNHNRSTSSVFVTYFDKNDALECIYSLENFSYKDYQLRPSLGTCKYCISFLYGQKCNNHNCMYLHSMGADEDSFSPEEISRMSDRFIQTTRPSRPENYLKCKFQDSRETVFPPRRMPGQENIEVDDEEESFVEEEMEEEVEEEEMTDDYEEDSELQRNMIRPFPLIAPSLNVDYSTTNTLMCQLGLDRLSVRAIMNLQQ